MTVEQRRTWLARFPPTQEVGILRDRPDLGWRVYHILVVAEPTAPDAPLMLGGDLLMYPMRPAEEGRLARGGDADG